MNREGVMWKREEGREECSKMSQVAWSGNFDSIEGFPLYTYSYIVQFFIARFDTISNLASSTTQCILTFHHTLACGPLLTGYKLYLTFLIIISLTLHRPSIDTAITIVFDQRPRTSRYAHSIVQDHVFNSAVSIWGSWSGVFCYTLKFYVLSSIVSC